MKHDAHISGVPMLATRVGREGIGVLHYKGVPYSAELICKLADRQGISGELGQIKTGGIINEVWTIGEGHVLRIVAEGTEVECDDEARRESAVAPLVDRAGITAPALIAWGEADDLAPRPWTLYERAPGVTLGDCEEPYEHFEPAYRQIGEAMARLHQMVVPEDVVPHLRTRKPFNIPRAIQRAIEEEALSEKEGERVRAFTDELAEIGGEPERDCFGHFDIHPWNVMVDPASGELSAIIDWGGASISDPAREFASMPFACLMPMVEGYRSAGGEFGKADAARASILSTQLALWEIRSPELALVKRQWWRHPLGGWPDHHQAVNDWLAAL